MTKENNPTIQFLSGGGEMGELTRNKDWSKTIVGNPETWPQSLKTTLSIILNSKFPMFLWWGDELTCFYNDAYRPSLGQNGKHPSILGQKAEDAWPEIWPIIKPLIDQVLAGGESTWSEDQLIPIYRNGRLEDVYWTFSYSPVMDESGKVTGVLVTCSETTEKVNSLKNIEERENQLNFTLNAAELGTWDLNPQTNRFFGNSRLKEWFGLHQDDEISLESALNVISENDRPKVIDAIQNALKPGSDGSYNIEYSILNAKNKKYRKVLAKGKALFDSEGSAYRFSGTLQDITTQSNAKEKIEESEKRFRNVVEQAPLGITILRGPEFIVEMANETYLQIVDKTEQSFLNKPLFDSLPEVKDIVDPLLTGVLKTGIPFYATDISVTLNRYKKQELSYFNLVYHPLREDNGDISGIMVVATEVTDSVKAKHALKESENQFRTLVMNSPIPMTIFRGEDFVIEIANVAMIKNIWRKKESDVIGKKVLEIFPELNNQKYPALLNEVLKTGKTHKEIESIAFVQGDDGMKKFYLDFEYAPLYELDGSISGVIITVNDVTEKVNARAIVEENQEKLSIVINASQLGTWELDWKTKKVIYSNKYIEIFGYKSKVELTHEQLVKHLHPDDLKIREEAFKQAFLTGSLKYQSRLIWSDGSIHWMEGNGKVIYDKENNPVKLIGTIRDITDSKLQQQELEEREQKFRLLADSMPQFVWTGDADGNLNYFNKSVYDYSGLTTAQIAAEGWLQIVHPEEREENIKKWLHSVSTGEEFIFEHRFKRFDGEYRWQLSRAIPQKDEDGTIKMWVGTSTDIQEQKLFATELEKQVAERTKELKHLNEELIKSEQRYHLMVEEIQDYAIIYLNINGDIENWNKGAEKIKGYKAEEIIGKNFSIFYTEYDLKNNLPKKLLGIALQTGKSNQEGWRVRKDGSYFWASIVINTLHDEQNNVIGFTKVTHDLTEKKQTSDQLKINSEQLEQKNKELERMNTELQSFAYVSSHDLQEPLRKIQTFANRVLEKEYQNLSENGKDYFNRMQKAASRMQTLIEDLLNYSRTNTTDTVYVETDITDIINEVKVEFKDLLTEKNAVIEIGNIHKVNIIPFQFRQIVHNLIGNSLKFSQHHVPPVIKFTSEIIDGRKSVVPGLISDKNYFHLSVIDNGIGFDPQYKERIFEVFQRLHGKSEYKGTGIGLAIVKKIIDNHHGIILANGEINKGAQFDIYIPV